MGFLSEHEWFKRGFISLFWTLMSLFYLFAGRLLDHLQTPTGSPFESHSVALPVDEATRSGRSPRDFRPLQSNPWCRHCLCNAYLRLFQGQWWNFWKCHVWLVYLYIPCISHVWLVYIPSIAGNSWHISYVNVWLPSSQLAEIHSSRGQCPIVKIVQKPHGENDQEFLRRMRLQFFTHMLPSGI